MLKLYRVTYEFKPYGESEYREWDMYVWCISEEAARGLGEAAADAKSRWGYTRNVAAEWTGRSK